MIQTVRVQTIIGKDPTYETIKQVAAVKTARVYRLEGVTEKEAVLLAEKLFSESINQIYTINKPILHQANQVIEIAYKPGVMNPEVASIVKASDDLGIKHLIAADASWEYGFFGNITKEEVINIIKKLKLFNPLTEHIITETPTTLIIKGHIGKTQTIPLRGMSDNQLLLLSKDKLFLSLEELRSIQTYFKNLQRYPTDVELETIAQTWSEHCAHKTFKAKLIVDGVEKEPLFSRIKSEALKHKKNIVSAFVDNSGVMQFYDGYAICGKGETHNSPSAIEPYGGAMTGVGGVFRDIVGTGHGAKPIASTDIFCFAPVDLDEKELPVGSLPPLYLLKNVVKGVKDYGNRMGIPTNNGSVHFHKDFRAKPTILVGSYGILPIKKAQKGKPKTGDIIIAIGGKTGRDGIHGATFSSAEMTDKTITVNATAVQIGNAIEEKRMFDALLEARDKNLIRALQDCGAGGFSSAIGEMGEDLGVTIHLEKAPLKYKSLSPWEIWVSESQERMIAAIPKQKLAAFINICKKYNVEYANLGQFDNDQKLKIFFGDDQICNLDMNFLHHGYPRRTMIATKPKLHLRGASSARLAGALASRRSSGLAKRVTSEVAKRQTPGRWRSNDFDSFKVDIPKSEKEWITILEKVLSNGNICSKEPIVRRYDHTVQGTNAMQLYSGELLDGPNDAAIVRPILSKAYGMIISHGLNPILNTFDPYWGSIWASTEAIANYVAVGGDYKTASLINNYVWPFPDEESLWSLDRSVDAVCDFMKTLGIPVISGKDSLSSTYKGKNGEVIKIPPVLCMSVFGKIPNVAKTVSADFKKNNSLIYLVGSMDFSAMAGSIYFDVLETPRTVAKASDFGLLRGGRIPHVNLKQLPKTLDAIHHAIQKNAILACHDISEGGIITSLFEMCVGGNNGADIHLGRWRGSDLDSSEVERPDFLLFNETAGCFLVEVENENTAKTFFKNVPHIFLGKTQKEKVITVSQENNHLFSAQLETLKHAWQTQMKEIFG